MKKKAEQAEKLRTIFDESSKMDAAYALKRYPLYRFCEQADGNGERQMRTQIICLSSELDHADSLLRMMIWCGQMKGFSLHIRIVSDNAEVLRSKMLEDMPLLRAYTNIAGEPKDVDGRPMPRYVEFEFVSDERILTAAKRGTKDKKKAELAGEQLGGSLLAGWTAVMMGGHTALFADRFSRGFERDTDRALILDCHESDLDAKTLAWLHEKRTVHCLAADDADQAQRASFREWLTDKAYRHHLLYMGNMHGLNNVDQFSRDAEGCASSAAAALHMSYKLKSIGLDPDKTGLVLAGEYAKRILGDTPEQKKNMGELTALEHRRWMMYQAVHGWKAASMDLCRRCCFETNSPLGKPIYRFKIDLRTDEGTLRLHPALVPGAGNMCLQGLTREQWDRYQSEEEIDGAPFDELAKVSLKLHLIAREKTEAAAETRGRHLDDLREIAGTNVGAIKAYAEFREWFATRGVSRHKAQDEENHFEIIRRAYQDAGVDPVLAKAALTNLRNDLKVINEFYSYNDYEVYDSLFVEHLAEIYCRPEKITLIKIAGGSRIDNIASSLLIEPDRVVMYGMEEADAERAEKVIRNYTTCKEFHHLPPAPYASFKSLVDRLRDFIRREKTRLCSKGLCLVDITNAPEDYVSAVWRVRNGSADLHTLGVIGCSSETQKIRNLCGFPMAQALRRHVGMSVKDILFLHGAVPASGDKSENAQRSLLAAKGSFQSVWTYFLRDKDRYELFSKLMKKQKPKSHMLARTSEENIFSRAYAVSNDVKRDTNIRQILKQLNEDAQISTYHSMQDNEVEIICSKWMHRMLEPMMLRLEAGKKGALHYQENEAYICISQRIRHQDFFGEWRTRTDTASRRMDTISVPLNLNEKQASALENIAWQMYREKTLRIFNVKPNERLLLKGVKREIECFHTACVKAARGELDATELIYDPIKECLYTPEKWDRAEELAGIEIPRECDGMVPQGSIPCALISKRRIEDRRYQMRKQIAFAGGLSGLLERIAKSESGKLSARVDENLVQPGVVDIVLHGEAWLLDSLCELFEKMQSGGAWTDLVYEQGRVYSSTSPCYEIEGISGENKTVLEEAGRFGVIENLNIDEHGKATFDIVNMRMLPVFDQIGNVLEYYTWYKAYACDFDDVINGYSIRWGAADTDNELDVLAVKGMKLMLISCKSTSIYIKDEEYKPKYNMYEIRMLANQFSRDAKAVLVYLSEDELKPETRRRADSIGVSVLVLDRKKQMEEIEAFDLSRRLNEIMDS